MMTLRFCTAGFINYYQLGVYHNNGFLGVPTQASFAAIFALVLPGSIEHRKQMKTRDGPIIKIEK